MDNSKFKDLVQKLSIFKNYSPLVVPVVIGVVGVLLFVPTQLMSSKFKKQIANESISMGTRIKSISKNLVAFRCRIAPENAVAYCHIILSREVHGSAAIFS